MAVAKKDKARKMALELAKNPLSITLKDLYAIIDAVEPKVRGNAEYFEFLESIRPVIEEQKNFWIAKLGHKGVKFPIEPASGTIRLYFKDRRIRDVVNKQQTIQDVLKECGVFKDDDDEHLNPIKSESARYPEEITENIAEIILYFHPKQVSETGNSQK